MTTDNSDSDDGSGSGSSSGKEEEDGANTTATGSGSLARSASDTTPASQTGPVRRKRGRPRMVDFLTPEQKAARLDRRRERNREAARRCRKRKKEKAIAAASSKSAERSNSGSTQISSFATSNRSGSGEYAAEQGFPEPLSRAPLNQTAMTTEIPASSNLAATMGLGVGNSADLAVQGFALPHQRVSSAGAPTGDSFAGYRSQPHEPAAATGGTAGRPSFPPLFSSIPPSTNPPQFLQPWQQQSQHPYNYSGHEPRPWLDARPAPTVPGFAGPSFSGPQFAGPSYSPSGGSNAPPFQNPNPYISGHYFPGSYGSQGRPSWDGGQGGPGMTVQAAGPQESGIVTEPPPSFDSMSGQRVMSPGTLEALMNAGYRPRNAGELLDRSRPMMRMDSLNRANSGQGDEEDANDDGIKVRA